MRDSELLLVENAEPLVTMNAGRDVHGRGWIAARGGFIAAVGSGPAPVTRAPAARFGMAPLNASRVDAKSPSASHPRR